ncbi:MAG: hypothetical protein M3439_08980 [Chloroflexota bacterium]|nr:hypothetical protein [Chloroflexota bacterium]
MAQVEAATSEIVTGEKSGRIDTRQTSVLAAICLAAGIAFLVYLLVAGLDTIGRHMLVISLVRLSFLAGLIAFAASVRRSEGLFRVGLLLAAASAALNMAGAFAWVVTDGWSYNAFDTDGTGFPPWYAFMIGGSAFLFALGTILTGIAAIRTRAKPGTSPCRPTRGATVSTRYPTRSNRSRDLDTSLACHRHTDSGRV